MPTVTSAPAHAARAARGEARTARRSLAGMSAAWSAALISAWRWLAALNPWLVDSVLASVMTAMGLRLAYGHRYPPPPVRPFDGFGLALSVGSLMVVAVRRRAPLAAVVASSGLVAVFEASGYWVALNQLGPQFAFATLATTRPPRQAAIGALCVAPVILDSNLRLWPDDHLDTIVSTLTWVVLLWVFCDGIRRLGEQARTLADRNARLAELTVRLDREQARNAECAVQEERIRIARELHDVAAHHMSVIAVQAELARFVFDADARAARAALGVIADTGREVLAEMRYLLSALRIDGADDAGPRPMPSLSRVAEVVERVRASGVGLDVVVTGVERPLSEGVDVCAYRIVQESLTNIVKHAPGATATLAIDYQPTHIGIAVVDDGGNAVPAGCAGRGIATERDTGQGLIGMRERARIYGGTLTAGARPRGGFEVALMLPAWGAVSGTVPAAATLPAALSATVPTIVAATAEP